jgi:hypothetical protein
LEVKGKILGLIAAALTVLSAYPASAGGSAKLNVPISRAALCLPSRKSIQAEG